jgi:GTP cyclohydrolase II
MTHVMPRDHSTSRLAAPPFGGGITPDPSVARLRAVHRAVADLRRGTPVLLEGEESLVLLPAETAGARGLGEFSALAGGLPSLLLAPVRAAGVLRRPVEQGAAAVALALPRAMLEPTALRSLADPTAEQLLPAEPTVVHVPPLAGAALALVKLARLLPAAVAAPALPSAVGRAAELGLLAVAAADVLTYPNQMAARLVRVAEAEVPLEDAPDARVVAFRGPDAGIEHLAIVVGRPEAAATPPLVRLHSECFTGDLLGSLRCDCGPQLRGAIKRIAEDGAGVVLYLAQEGRGIGLVNKLRAYTLQDRGLDTLDANRALGWGADERTFLVAATMLEELGLREVRLLTNNPDKVAALAACGLTVHREAHAIAPNGVNDRYLATKAARFGHLLG